MSERQLEELRRAALAVVDFWHGPEPFDGNEMDKLVKRLKRACRIRREAA